MIVMRLVVIPRQPQPLFHEIGAIDVEGMVVQQAAFDKTDQP